MNSFKQLRQASNTLRVALSARAPWFVAAAAPGSRRPEGRLLHLRAAPPGGFAAGALVGLSVGAMRGPFALMSPASFAQHKPSIAGHRVLGWEQTRSMRHGQRRGKLGRSATDR
jgi:hypothetical protein